MKKPIGTHRRTLPRYLPKEPLPDDHISPEVVDTPTQTTPGGDTRKLRGIPAIGKGVSGHIPGSQPGQHLT
jgi:hypothetical protein